MRADSIGVVLLSGEQGLIDVARVPVLHRLLFNGRKAGIDTWYLLTWQHASGLDACLAADPRLSDVPYQVYDLRETNDTHLAAALPADEVTIISCTAVFDHRVLRAIQTCEGLTLGIMRAAQTQTTGTGVSLCDGQVMASTTLDWPAYQAIGLLRCPGALLGQMIRQTRNAMLSTPDPLQPVLAELLATPTATVKALEVSPQQWFPLTAPYPTSAARVEMQLLQQLGRDGDSPIVRWVARRVSRKLTQRLMHTRVKPNHITLVSGAIGISGAVLLAQPIVLWQFLGSLLFLLSTIIDGCDGELARLTLQESAFGAKLDVTMDNVVHGVLFPAIALGLYRQQHDTLYLVLGAFVLGGVFLSMLVFLPHVLRPQTVRTAQTRLHDSLASRDFAYFLPILAACQALQWFLWAAAVGTYLFATAWMVMTWRQRQRKPILHNQEPSSV